jgi:multicomponent Na+:H+ antiporter subunit B
MRRKLLFFLFAPVILAVLVAALRTVARFGDYRGPYGDLVNATVVREGGTPQAIAAVMFDYRGFDTLGEEFILFTAVAGTLLLMRRQPGEHEQDGEEKAERKVEPVDDVLRVAGLLLFPVAAVAGVSTILHGHLTPGGGFQGGVLLASAFYFVFLSGEYSDFEQFLPGHVPELLEAFGAAAFVLLALFPLVQGDSLLENVLPKGSFGDLFSAGTLPVLNGAVGIEVAAAFLLLILSFLRQSLGIRGGGRK